MRLRHFDDAAEFYQRTEAFLLAHEAEHNLLLGFGARLARHPDPDAQPPFLATVEDGGSIVLAAMMTPPHNLVLSRTDEPAALAPLADELRRRYPALPGVLGPAGVSRAFAETWQWVSGQSYHPGVAQRIFQLDAVRPVEGMPGELRRATPADRDLVTDWLAAFHREALGEMPDRGTVERAADRRLTSDTNALYLWHDGEPVSMAGISGPTPNGIRVNAVYTPPERRGRGYASACVAALSQRMLDSGRRHCFLFTDLANPTSNRIYQAIGYRPVCDVDEYRFRPVAERNQ